MPSPIGHALGGVLAGWLAAPVSPTADAARLPAAARARSSRFMRWLEDARGRRWREPLTFALLGLAADADFLAGRHNYETHSLGAAVLVAASAWLMSGGRLRWALAAGLAYGSHILLDWLGSDATPPIGVMALWPFSDRFYQSHLHWFMAIWRESWRPGFVAHNLLAVVREVVLLGPLVAVVWWWRARRPGLVDALPRKGERAGTACPPSGLSVGRGQRPAEPQ